MDRVRGFEVVVDEKRKTTGEITLPTAGTSKAMAYDFYSTEEWHAAPNAVVKVWTDVKAYMKAYSRYKSGKDYFSEPPKLKGYSDEELKKIQKAADIIKLSDIFGE